MRLGKLWALRSVCKISSAAYYLYKAVLKVFLRFSLTNLVNSGKGRVGQSLEIGMLMRAAIVFCIAVITANQVICTAIRVQSGNTASDGSKNRYMESWIVTRCNIIRIGIKILRTDIMKYLKNLKNHEFLASSSSGPDYSGINSKIWFKDSKIQEISNWCATIVRDNCRKGLCLNANLSHQD